MVGFFLSGGMNTPRVGKDVTVCLFGFGFGSVLNPSPFLVTCLVAQIDIGLVVIGRIESMFLSCKTGE